MDTMAEENVISLKEWFLRMTNAKAEEKKKEAQQKIHEALVSKGFIDPEDEDNSERGKAE